MCYGKQGDQWLRSSLSSVGISRIKKKQEKVREDGNLGFSFFLYLLVCLQDKITTDGQE